VSGRSEVFLGLIALAVLIMAVIQVGAIVVLARVARRVDALTTQVERDVRPLLDRLTALAAEASRTAGLATTQVERFDRLFADVAGRVDRALIDAQAALAVPARQGVALLAGLRAGVAALRELRRGMRRRAEEEDALFIG
jgi:hypothetical protein